MAYATVEDVQARMLRPMSTEEQAVCATLLDDAAILIDAVNVNATADVKKTVSCRMAVRALGDGDTSIPMGAMQGSMSGLGYSQSWTLGSGGSAGELYISKTEKMLLGRGNQIGTYSPVEDICERDENI